MPEPGSSDNYDSDDSEIAYLAVDSQLTCHKCHATFGTRDDTRKHVKHCGKTPVSKGERRGRANLLNPDRHTCGFCETVFDSRNALFRHLKHCKDAKNGTVRRPQNLSTTVDDAVTDSYEPTDANFITTEPRLPASAFHVKDAPAAETGTNDSTLSTLITQKLKECIVTRSGEALEIPQ